jgi:hypothetical protein
MRQFDDGDALRPEKQDEGNKPEPDGNAAVGGDGGNDVEIEDRDNEKQDQVTASEGSDEVRLRGLGVSGQRLPQRLKPDDLSESNSSPGLAPGFGMTNLVAAVSRRCASGRLPRALHVPVAPSRANRRCRRRQIDAYRCQRRCAELIWSIVRPTNTAAP